MGLRVGLDARGLNTNFIRGMGEVLDALVRHIGPAHDIEWSFYSNRPDLPFHRPPASGDARVSLRDIPGSRFHLWEQAFLPGQAMAHGLDLLHCTSTTLPFWQPVPTVVTIHDTIQWNTGEDMAPGFYRDRLLPAAYARCKAIITISHHSRRDILRLWPALDGKVHVIHHGVNALFLQSRPAPTPEPLCALGVVRPYLLYLGGATPRKRLDWTLNLYRNLGRPDVDLVVCGVPEAQHAAYRDKLPPDQRNRVIFLPFVPAEAMPSLYQNAIAVLYPTLYEGFGLPALNAQAVGTPIVLSAVSSLLELVGPTSVALPPDDEPAWLDACRALIDRRIGAAVPDEASRTWASQFTWDRAAAATWDVYQAAAKRRG